MARLDIGFIRPYEPLFEHICSGSLVVGAPRFLRDGRGCAVARLPRHSPLSLADTGTSGSIHSGVPLSCHPRWAARLVDSWAGHRCDPGADTSGTGSLPVGP